MAKGKFKPRHPEKYDGKYPIFWRSRWEGKFMQWCDNNPNIIFWSSESIAIPYYSSIKGRRARYFPDFLIKVRSKTGIVETYLVEIKPYHETVPPVIKPRQRLSTKIYAAATYQTNVEKWIAAKEFCRLNSVKWMLITERELFKQKV